MYVDYIDLPGSFEKIILLCRPLGGSAQTKSTLAVPGFLGVGYFVRECKFRIRGRECHRVYVTDRTMVRQLVVDSTLGLVTGLSQWECWDRFVALFGQCAQDGYVGRYDDSVRIRANHWLRAAMLLGRTGGQTRSLPVTSLHGNHNRPRTSASVAGR